MAFFSNGIDVVNVINAEHRGEYAFAKFFSRSRNKLRHKEEKMKKFLAVTLAMTMAFGLVACGGSSSGSTAETTTEAAADTAAEATTEATEDTADAAAEADTEAAAVATGVEDGVLTVGMECAYAPYNWTQSDDSNGAVAIENNPGSYANGYDVMIAKKICEANGWELKVMAIEWDGLIPALQAGTIDAVIAGQSMTEERLQQVDMAGPYFYASIVCVTKKDAEQASATGISNLSGTCTAQTGTIWYDSCLPQIPGADIQTQSETAPAMIMAVESGTVDFICTDMPTAMGACATYPDLTILDFSDTDDNFQVDEGEINIGISVLKGNSVLKDAMNSVLNDMTVDDFNDIMNDAIAAQPEI